MNRFTCLFALLSVAVLALPAQGREPGRPAPAEQVATQSLNMFAIDLYKKLSAGKEGENQFYSPASVSVALSMAMAGADGETRDEMAKVLHIGGDPSAVQEAIGRLIAQWNSDDKDRPFQLRVANRLWGQKGFPYQQSFLALTKKEYGAEMGMVDFQKNPDAARQEINEWVEKQTNDRIKNLFPEDSITGDTRAVLANAIYFKGDWATPFTKESTREKQFYPGAAKKLVKVPMMNQTASFNYLEDPTVQVLELPYKGSDLAMMFVLPKERTGLPELEKNLIVERINGWAARARRERVNATIPKFKLEAYYNLVDPLKGLGMVSAFDPNEANFSGITSAQELYISGIFHKAFCLVDEKGTEAAAATGIAFGIPSAPPAQPKIFNADHPFLFVLRDTKTGAILFMGRMFDPSL